MAKKSTFFCIWFEHNNKSITSIAILNKNNLNESKIEKNIFKENF